MGLNKNTPDENRPAEWYVSKKGRKDALNLVRRTIELIKQGPFAKQASGIKAAELGKQSVPPTLKAFLTFDRTFKSIKLPWGLKPRPLPFFGGFGEKGPLPAPINFLDAVHAQLDKLEYKIPRNKRVIFDGVNHILSLAPKALMYQLPSCGEDPVFLYLGKSNSEGEFPICQLFVEADSDPQLAKQLLPEKTNIKNVIFLNQCFFEIIYPSFDLYLAGNLVRNIPDVTNTKGFKQMCKEHAKRNNLKYA
ncbi:MAG TPA: hypothetical protein VE973_04035 [Candidatus Limnocylindria bacterium]|nr:hypothetical protein [Candidatus Limnocylindria bacterium]